MYLILEYICGGTLAELLNTERSALEKEGWDIMGCEVNSLEKKREKEGA